jgi:hypothetical protein
MMRTNTEVKAGFYILLTYGELYSDDFMPHWELRESGKGLLLL